MELTIFQGLLAALILLIGFLIGWLWARYKFEKEGRFLLEKDLDSKYVPRSQFDSLTADRERLADKLENKEDLIRDAYQELAKKDTRLSYLEEKLNQQKEEILGIQDHFKKEFEHLAGKLLKVNSREFAESNQKQITEILKPLKEKLGNFEKKVEDTYEKNVKDRSELKGEIKQLMELNQRISDEANHLANALKGDQKQQGNWGELILERILERSGLQKGIEYKTQESDTNAEGKRIKPDVVLYLPDNKHIIIDAKVSLSAYERFVKATDPESENQALHEHITSIRSHIKGLSAKSYPSATKLQNPDFVLMFLPIESSFSLAVKTDDEIFQYAWERKIVIVSPSTLLATLRTVASIWKQEKQTRYALEIAKRAGNLYDKFVGFVEDMQKIGHSLDQGQKAYEMAMNKLHTGRGNLVRRSEKIKSLGVKARKKLPNEIVDMALDEEE